jgi:hypothetical protein
MQSTILSLIWYLVEASTILEDKKHLEKYFSEWGDVAGTDVYYDKSRYENVVQLIKILFNRDILPELEEELKSNLYDLVKWEKK